MKYQKVNNITGWIVFAIATLTYLLTLEMTASYWDCGEFIAVSYKLMVPHPPGAPFFLLMGRIFSFFALGDVTQVAYWINMVSVLSSSFSILFLFWTITLLGRKLLKIKSVEDLPLNQTILLVGAGAVGALAYTFSDSFWFSAVEAEVYAMSSFFTAFVVWAILKWDLIEDESRANRWLILIAYMMGLSIGVHLLNLVTIPALGLIYYFKKYKPSFWGIVIAMAISGAFIILINNLIIPGLPSLASMFEIDFVNTLNLPFGTGLTFFILILIGLLTYSIYETQTKVRLSDKYILSFVIIFEFLFAYLVIHESPILIFVLSIVINLGIYILLKKNINKFFIITILGYVPGLAIWYLFFEDTKREKFLFNIDLNKLNTFFIGITFVLIGYSSYSLVVIRSNYNPPIDENNPEDIMSFVSYLKREQYGNRPLLHGQYYTARVVGQKDGDVVYTKGKDKYEITDRKFAYEYDPAETTILPRIYSTSPAHQERYREILGLREGEKPSFWTDNIWFLFKYQIKHMYMRYFMWNFAGRASDIQDADWLSPLAAFEDVPAPIADNHGRNNYFMIPLLLGLIGLLFQFFNDKRNFAVVGMLFFLTGIALILYLNSPPTEPRERDYIYVASFYAFAIWIGFGVIAIAQGISQAVSNKKMAGGIAIAIGLMAPAIMAAEGWDDHDRSNRYFSVDTAKNFLSSCADNAIMFTGGDNDTFPLWYAQNVEGYRTDMRVLVLSYSNTDWYIEQMLDKHYTSEPLPLSLTMKNYQQGGPNDYLPYEDLKLKGPIDLKTFLSLLKNDDKRLRYYQSANVIPSKQIALRVDKASVLQKGIIPKGKDSLVVDQMVFRLKGNGLEKKDLMILDLIATNNWERPIYFNNTSLNQLNFNVDDYIVQEGNTYRLLPIKNPQPARGSYLVDTDIMYDNVMNKFQFREMDNPDVYYNEDYRNFVVNHRSTLNTLAEALLDEGKEDKARKVLLYSLESMPDIAVNYDYTSVQTAGMLMQLGETEKAKDIAQKLGTRADELLSYYLANNISVGFELQRNIIILNELQRMLKRYGEDEMAKEFEDALTTHYGIIENSRR